MLMQASRTTLLSPTCGLRSLTDSRCKTLASCSRNISHFHANPVLSAYGSVPSFGIRASRPVDYWKRGLTSSQISVETLLPSSHPLEVSLSGEHADSPSRSTTTRPNEERPREIPKKKLALLYARGFPLYMLPQDVQTKFEHLGPVKHMWMERTAAGELTGDATIMYENPTQVERIMRLQSLVPIVVEGNVIKASYCWGLNKPVGNEWLLVYNLPEGVLEEEVKEALKAEAVRFSDQIT
ncbi:uncharacterized protein LAESUDRAFT_321728 [Laetiporus sulphureus 93-53]|uniref:RRM domain-containing protein n=1 Tax=Laetiporus sulphureus 93-53 TaxID=1314785 RepID=A0A165D1U1_9APHY|nr:uncharacterized protein LAESUDRAFT_321728 [Laetiporus sulphureus 93-53]KZT03982.1 hypothetical protein LAESUDRAFT_321728 [Laetiporus sulphureus 93-53]